jgi:hypothetical protein
MVALNSQSRADPPRAQMTLAQRTMTFATYHRSAIPGPDTNVF